MEQDLSLPQQQEGPRPPGDRSTSQLDRGVMTVMPVANAEPAHTPGPLLYAQQPRSLSA